MMVFLSFLSTAYYPVPAYPISAVAEERRRPPFTPHQARITLLLLRYWLPRAKLCSFSAKFDRCDSTTRCSDGPRRCNRGSMKFNTFAEGTFLRLPRSYRVAEKSSQIGSREPNCAVFQQNPTVAQAVLDAPMDSDAVIAQA